MISNNYKNNINQNYFSQHVQPPNKSNYGYNDCIFAKNKHRKWISM